MDQNEKENQALYSSLFERHGGDYRSLNWGSKRGQERRFEVLAEIGIQPGSSLLDVGCGLGDFLGWANHQSLDIHYTGLDITLEMVNFAATQYPEAQIHLGTLGEVEALREARFDYIIASGIFAHRQLDAERYMQKSIAQMWAKAVKGLAFNSLSAWANEQSANEFHADPLSTLNFCRQLSPWVTLRHDYAEHDFTIYVYRESNFDSSEHRK